MKKIPLSTEYQYEISLDDIYKTFNIPDGEFIRFSVDEKSEIIKIYQVERA